MSDTNKILDRIRKLLALAEGAGTPEEAGTAYATAQKLIAQHALTDEQVRAKAGALLAGRPPEHIAACSLFGRHLGIAYQIYDDLVDLRALVERHTGLTSSAVGRQLLDNWDMEAELFVKVMPQDYKRVLAARAAAEAQLERNQRHIEQGRENMKMYQKANKTGEDGSDGSDAEEGTATRRQSALARKRKNNRSVFGDASSTEEIRMQLQQDRISSLACGVSRKTSTKFGDYVIPAAPTRVGGAVKLVTSNDKKRSLRRPVILESRGMEAVLERVFITPRVVDQRAFEDFATNLKGLVRDAAVHSHTLGAASAGASGSRSAV